MTSALDDPVARGPQAAAITPPSSTAATPSRPSPGAAVGEVADTTGRFFRAIAERVPADRIVELYLFPPLRQGPIESGVAVIAVADDAAGAEPTARGPERPASAPGSRPGSPSGPSAASPDASSGAPPGASSDASSDASPPGSTPGTRPGSPPGSSAGSSDGSWPGSPSGERDPALSGADAERSGVRRERHAVYTATYRHTRKGPERGAWAVDVVVEADAPLATVATVVRGVQRRAGGDAAADADRLTGDAFRDRLAPPAPPQTSP